LEFGGGPIIMSLISAAPYVSEIVFSDYIESARKQVVMWKDNNPMIKSPHFKRIVNKLEGNLE